MRYKKFKRKINDNGKVVEKYMAKLHLESPVDLNEIAKRIEIQTTASEADVHLVLLALEKNIKLLLAEGHSVKLGHLGSFYPTLNARTVDSPEDITPQTIYRISCNFKPCKELRSELGDAKLNLLDNEIYMPRERTATDPENVKKRKKPYKR
ncbi:MAG: HU family DNA-binding protein [Bacteroidales bacterium]|nr:HU family DNA-binding protein [Bacteroidales bacterium]MBQ7984429.1 HU family DNA-binding protein [Bacteroidales bacterium]